MSSATMDEFGKLILRVSIGAMLILHGIGKLINGIGPVESMLAAKSMPAIIAWGVYIGELIAPALLIMGIYTRLGGLLIVINMLFAIGLAHKAQIFQLNAMWAWSLELQGLFLFGGLAVAFLGAGRYSAAGKGGRWN